MFLRVVCSVSRATHWGVSSIRPRSDGGSMREEASCWAKCRKGENRGAFVWRAGPHCCLSSVITPNIERLRGISEPASSAWMRMTCSFHTVHVEVAVNKNKCFNVWKTAQTPGQSLKSLPDLWQWRSSIHTSHPHSPLQTVRELMTCKAVACVHAASRRNLVRNVNFILVYLLLLSGKKKTDVLRNGIRCLCLAPLPGSSTGDLREQTLAGFFNHEHL